MEWEKERVGFIQKYGQRRRLNAQTESLASRLDLPLPLGNFSGRTSPRSSVIRRQECERRAVPGPSSCPSVFVDVLFGGVFLPSFLPSSRPLESL